MIFLLFWHTLKFIPTAKSKIQTGPPPRRCCRWTSLAWLLFQCRELLNRYVPVSCVATFSAEFFCWSPDLQTQFIRHWYHIAEITLHRKQIFKHSVQGDSSSDIFHWNIWWHYPWKDGQEIQVLHTLPISSVSRRWTNITLPTRKLNAQVHNLLHKH